MLDATYFHDRLPQDVRAMRRSVSVALHLHDGTVFYVNRVVSAEPGFVVLYVYPSQGGIPKLRDDWRGALESGEPATLVDCIAVAYTNVQRVQLSLQGPRDPKEIGFRAE